MKYRVIYWVGSMVTEWVVAAKTERDAIAKFRAEKGDAAVLKVELVK